MCSGCGKNYPHNRVQTLCQACGAPILAEYDTKAIGAAVKPADLRERESSIWRYREFLPLPQDARPVTLREGKTGFITQALGGSFTVYVEGNLFRVAGKDADALGKEVVLAPELPPDAELLEGATSDWP